MAFGRASLLRSSPTGQALRYIFFLVKRQKNLSTKKKGYRCNPSRKTLTKQDTMGQPK